MGRRAAGDRSSPAARDANARRTVHAHSATRDDGRATTADDDDGATARARAMGRPKMLDLEAIARRGRRAESPNGPLGASTDSSRSSDVASDSEEANGMMREEMTRACVLRLVDRGELRREVTTRAPRREAARRRRVGDETFVCARARTPIERRKCEAARTYQMHVLRSAGTFDACVGYGAAQTCEDDVRRVSADPGTEEYYVASENPFDDKVYGVMRLVRCGVREIIDDRFDAATECSSGLGFVIDRFFATTAANEIAAAPNGPEFIRRLMIDAVRAVAAKRDVICPKRTIPILSATPVDVSGARAFDHVDYEPRGLTRYEDGIMCDDDVMLEREHWVTRKFFKLYVIPAVAPSNDPRAPGKKTWSAFGKARDLRAEADSDADEDEREPLVVTLHAIASRDVERRNDDPLSVARAIANECVLELNDDERASIVVDALACALRDDSGAPSHEVDFDSSCSGVFIRAVRTIVGDAHEMKKRAVVCVRTSVDSVENLMDSLESSMSAAGTDACVLVSRCLSRGRHFVLCDGDVLTRDMLACAASRGIFADGGVFTASTDGDHGVVAARFIRREFRVRTSRVEDVDALVDIEAEAWLETPEMRTSLQTVRDRIEKNASMNFVVEDIRTGCVRGVMYTQYVDDVESPLNAIWETKESNRREVGSTNVVQLLDVFVDQRYGALCASAAISVGQELRNHVLSFAEHSGVQQACAVTRTRGYRATQQTSPSLTYDEYVHGDVLDRGVFFHTSVGAEVLRVVRPWRSRDYENDGNGVLIRYDVREYAYTNAVRRGRSALKLSKRRPSDPTRSEGRPYVNSIEAVAWEARAQTFPVIA
ncbi:yersiniabactin polyketide/non-rib [Ostreococcus tauri]|uniref:Yersiniabactin polyketide/non-rib n=1 Tax=Ostreococcus tauri TaxID=70448 RepID=A0A1Y5IB55_OSTTA|nr:yersiniabactin polyketide/non-rib [Ostreococcus tauri]